MLATLKVGDFVEAKFIFDREIARGEVVKLDEYCIYLSVQVDGTPRITSDPKSNIIYIRKLSQ